MNFKVLPFLLFLSGFLTAKQTSILIIENNRDYVILDSFEQRLQPAQNRLPKWTPFEVLEENYLLGDQITTAAKVKFLSHIYLIQKGEEGQLICSNPSSKALRYTVKKMLNDTIQIKAGARINYSKSPAVSDNFTLKERGPFYRLCAVGHITILINSKEQNRVYFVQNLTRNMYEYVRLEPYRQARKFDNLPVAQIQRFIDKANRLNTKYFQYFASRYHILPVYPKWGLHTKGKTIQVYLNTKSVRMENSFRHLLQQIKNSLPSAQYSVKAVENKIVIESLPK